MPDAPHTEPLHDELETDWIDAMNQRYGHANDSSPKLSGAMASSSSAPAHEMDAETEAGLPQMLQRLDSQMNDATGSSNDTDPDSVINSFIDPNSNRVICDLKSGRRIGIGYFSLICFFFYCIS